MFQELPFVVYHVEDDEERPQHQEYFLVHNVQREKAHGVGFLEKQISFLQIAVVFGLRRLAQQNYG